jgi:antitoxin VapB
MLTKVFQSGNSQAVRLPKEFRLNVSEVEIFKRGEEIIIRPKPQDLTQAYQLLTQMPSDFMQDGRHDEPPQDREVF